MEWQREFDTLPDRDKALFAKILSLLFDETFLLRDVWDAKEARLVGNHDYRFVERVRPLMEAYLQVSGWALQVDSLRGVIAIYNRFGRNRRQLDKLTTYVLFILRLIYDEQMEQVSMRKDIIISLRDVYEKLHTLGFIEKKLSQSRLQSTLMLLRRISILERIEGSILQPESRWIIYPSVRLLVPEERINQIYETLQGGPGADELEFDEDDSEMDGAFEEEIE